MPDQNSSSQRQVFVGNSLAAAIQIGLILLLAIWCFNIIRPFIGIVAWAAIIAIAIFPLHGRLAAALGGRAKTSSVILVLIGLSILLVPAWMLTGSTIETAKAVASGLNDGTLSVPPPDVSVEEWPLVGERIFSLWSEAATGLQDMIRNHAEQLTPFSTWMLKTVAGSVAGVVGFAFSIIIAGVLLLNAGKGYEAFRGIGRRLAGERGAGFVDLTVATIRSVAKGVLGVALIQTLLAAIGLLVMQVPGAGIWAAIVLVLAVMQLPPLLVLGPVAIWVFSTAEPVPATVFLVYSLLVSFSDGILKPLLLGRGVDVPMLVILLGAIGGMISAGIIGLFTGAVVLAIGYQLFNFWLHEDTDKKAVEADD
jgi:predicted PurR-regulated permease PerM